MWPSCVSKKRVDELLALRLSMFWVQICRYFRVSLKYHIKKRSRGGTCVLSVTQDDSSGKRALRSALSRLKQAWCHLCCCTCRHDVITDLPVFNSEKIPKKENEISHFLSHKSTPEHICWVFLTAFSCCAAHVGIKIITVTLQDLQLQSLDCYVVEKLVNSWKYDYMTELVYVPVTSSHKWECVVLSCYRRTFLVVCNHFRLLCQQIIYSQLNPMHGLLLVVLFIQFIIQSMKSYYMKLSPEQM